MQTDTQNINDWRSEKQKFEGERLINALYYGATTAIITIIFLFIFNSVDGDVFNFTLPDDYQLFSIFEEWITEDDLQKVGSPGEEIITSIKRLVKMSAVAHTSTIESGDHQGDGNTAAIARLLAVYMISGSVFCSYRKMTPRRYKVYGQKAQLKDFIQLIKKYEGTILGHKIRPRFFLTRLSITLASAFGSHVIMSATWPIISLMFPALELNINEVGFVAALFTGVTVFVATYWALAATTHDILGLGLAIFVVGLSVSFAIAEPTLTNSPLCEYIFCYDACLYEYWYDVNISTLGIKGASAPLFTATLASTAVILLVLWLDIDSHVRKMIEHKNKISEKRTMLFIDILYILIVVGLLAVGVVRTEGDLWKNEAVHKLGAVGAVFATFGLSWILPMEKYRKVYKWISTGFLGFCFFVILLSSFRFNHFKFVGPGNGDVINMAALEIILFIAIWMWMYVAVNGLISYANQTAKTEPTPDGSAVGASEDGNQ
jgi:hypothetical protein